MCQIKGFVHCSVERTPDMTGVRSIENSVQHSTGRTSNMIFIVVRKAYA